MGIGFGDLGLSEVGFVDIVSAWVAKSVFNLVLRPIRQLGINGRQRSRGRALFLRASGRDARR
jgi:hypothetical protein